MLFASLCIVTFVCEILKVFANSSDGEIAPTNMYSFTKKHPSAILAGDMNGLSNITWSETTNPIECARLTYSECNKPKGFLYNSKTRLCKPIFWTQEVTNGQNIDGNGTLYLFNQNQACKDGFLPMKYGRLNNLACLTRTSVTKPYHFAGLNCADQGGYLASAKTAEKLELLLDLAQGQSFWVGVDDRKKGTIFVWAEDGSILTPQQTLEVFSPGEPSNTALEHCVSVRAPEVKLNDRKCDRWYYYMCEAKPGCE